MDAQDKQDGEGKNPVNPVHPCFLSSCRTRPAGRWRYGGGQKTRPAGRWRYGGGQAGAIPYRRRPGGLVLGHTVDRRLGRKTRPAGHWRYGRDRRQGLAGRAGRAYIIWFGLFIKRWPLRRGGNAGRASLKWRHPERGMTGTLRTTVRKHAWMLRVLKRWDA